MGTLIKGLGPVVIGVGLILVLSCVVFTVLHMTPLARLIGSAQQVPPILIPKPQPLEKMEKIRNGVIIFVHGLNGNPESTWTNDAGQSWIHLMQQEAALKNFDYYTFGYGTDIVLDKTQISDAVATLRNHIDGEFSGYSHLVIVAHSMGGLIARNALAQSGVRARPGLVVTLVTCATPFLGSDLADALDSLTKIRSRQIDVLMTTFALQGVGDEAWERTRRECGNRLYHLAAFEGKKIPVSGKGTVFVVKQNSATKDADEFFECDADHFSIVKPADRIARVHTRVLETIIKREHQLITFPHLPDGFRVERVEVEKANGQKDEEVHHVLGPGAVPVRQDIRVPAGMTLRLEPGTKLVFEGGKILECQGKLLAGRKPKDKTKVSTDPSIVFDFGWCGREGAVFLKGPHAQGSVFVRCEFRGGRGVLIAKPNPKRHETVDWNRAVVRDEKDSAKGGAVLLVGTTEVSFYDCLFTGNQAYLGGVAAILGSNRLEFWRCRFEANTSRYGGGAVYAQVAEVYFYNCPFVENETGSAYPPSAEYPRPLQGFACGGAVYLGESAKADFHTCAFLKNRSAYVGGAIYLLDTNPRPYADTDESLMADCFLIENQSGVGRLGGGGAIYLDGKSFLNLSDIRFIANRSAASSPGGAGPAHDEPQDLVRGQSIFDANRFPSLTAEPISGLQFNSTIELCQAGVEMPGGGRNDLNRWVASLFKTGRQGEIPGGIWRAFFCVPPSEDSAAADPEINDKLAIGHREPGRLHVTPIISSPMASPRFSRPGGADRKIDTIIIHHTSALNWDDKGFRDQFGPQIAAFEDRVGRLPPDRRKFDWRHCKQIFELYGVSAHYLISRDGIIRQLVPDEDIAYHAGESRMPEPDGRRNVNLFSIGIELIATHPADDSAIRDNVVPAYTEEQYAALHLLLLDLYVRHGMSVDQITDKIIGHKHVAPGRKKDPGPIFNWDRVLNALRGDLLRWQPPTYTPSR